VLPGTKNWRRRAERSKAGNSKPAQNSGTSLRERVLGVSNTTARKVPETALEGASAGSDSLDRDEPGHDGHDVDAGHGSNSNDDSGAPRHDNGDHADKNQLTTNRQNAAVSSNDGVPVNPDSRLGAKDNAASEARKSAVAHLDIQVPERIEKYVLGARLGSGTCGVVHKALDEVLGREVAIKLSPVGEPVETNGKVPGAQRAYQTEVFAAGRLRHPNVITVYDAGQHGNLNYFVMEAVDGLSLKHYGKGQKLLPTYRALEIICDCCMALDYTHRQDILHRDIKPANIMVARDGTVKLLDFGIAVGLSESSGLSRRGPTLGTPNYMSPEQILGKELGPASDFYSLGTVLFELLTGKQLFKAKKVKDLFKTVVHQPAPELLEFRPDLPTELSAALIRVLHKKPERRFQSGVEMIDALTRFIDHFRSIEDRPAEDQAVLPHLQALPFFDSFTDSDIAKLTTHAPLLDIQAGEEVLRDGNVNRELLVLVDGCVRAVANDTLEALYGPGECIGERGFIHGISESVRYSAVNNMRVLQVGPDVLSTLPPKLHLHYYKCISDSLVQRIAGDVRVAMPDISLD